ncbi:MAG: T9SS type A sorting domain-containing protein [Armatimonadetes bacterium]|nr:T9SS type A sorting domain-containing protein [Armatimonadota bacterium]
MKKLLFVLFTVFCMNLLFAELVVDIPFDLDIIGDSFAATGPYEYESDWITATNTGSETYTYTFLYTFENLPAGWLLSVCNPTACFMPNYPAPIVLGPDESEQIHIIISVTSTGGFVFNFTFDEGDLTEPLSFDFTFNTEDNVGIENESQIPVSEVELYQNYPNPFNPTTTISYNLTEEEAETASIEIFNLKGQLIKSFTNLTVSNSFGSVVWDGSDDRNNFVSSGIYYYKLNSVLSCSLKRMTLIK